MPARVRPDARVRVQSDCRRERAPLCGARQRRRHKALERESPQGAQPTGIPAGVETRFILARNGRGRCGERPHARNGRSRATRRSRKRSERYVGELEWSAYHLHSREELLNPSARESKTGLRRYGLFFRRALSDGSNIGPTTLAHRKGAAASGACRNKEPVQPGSTLSDTADILVDSERARSSRSSPDPASTTGTRSAAWVAGCRAAEGFLSVLGHR